MTTLRYYQKECVDEMQRRSDSDYVGAMSDEISSSIHVLQLFCGTGKTRIYTHFIEENIRDIVVIAFPRIALLHQYYDDYYCQSKRLEENYDLLIVSADHNNKESLHSFISKSKSKSKLILVTHTSFEEIITMLPDKPDLIIIDEFHHFNTQKKMQFLFDITNKRASPRNTIIFGFTATPHKLHTDYIIYKYGYFEALRDGNCKNFEVDLYITPDIKTPDNLYKGLFYLAEKSRIKNILCFHSLSEVSGKGNRSSVADYVNIRADLNYKNSYFTDGIESHTITGTMKNDARLSILNTIADASDKKLSIVHTCNTVSEGIDTKSIKSICFVDAKGSAISIIQCIGRITRLDENNDEPSRVLIPFFEVECNKEAFSGRGSIANCVSIDDSDDDSAEDDSSPIISKTEDDLINESGYKTIMGVVSFLRKDNPALFNAAIANPKIITKMEYDFHFEKIIVNKSKGDMYVGKNIEDIKESNVIICSSELGGEVYEIDDFFSDRNVSKEVDVDEWIYLYTDENNKVIDTLGSSKRKPYKMTKPKKPLVVCGTDDADKFFEELVREKVNKSRMEKIMEMCKWIRKEKRLPRDRDKEFGNFFGTIKSIKRGIKNRNTILSDEEDRYLSTFFKTKNWHLLYNSLFQEYTDEWLDPDINIIEYKVETRLDKIKEFCSWVKNNNMIPIKGDKMFGLFFVTIKSIKRGTVPNASPISDEEDRYLSTFFKTKNWHLITNDIFQTYITEWLDPNIKEIGYIEITRLDKIKEFCNWVKNNNIIPNQRDKDKVAFFNRMKNIKKGTINDCTALSDEEDSYLSNFFKTEQWYLINNTIFQKKLNDWLNPDINIVDYDFSKVKTKAEVTRLDKIKDFCNWVEKEKRIPKQSVKSFGFFFSDIKSIKRGTSSNKSIVSEEEDSYLSDFFKTEQWYFLSDAIFQKKLQDWLNPDINIVDYDFSKVRGASEIDVSLSKVKTKAEVKPPPNMKEEIKNNSSFIFTPESRHDKACKDLLDSYFENNDEKGKKRLIDLQKIKAGIKKSGSKLYETIDNYLMSLHEKWETVTPEELTECYKSNKKLDNNIESTSEIKHAKEDDDIKVTVSHEEPKHTRESMPRPIPIKGSPILSVAPIDDNNNEDCKEPLSKTLILGGTKNSTKESSAKESSLTNKTVQPKKNYGLNMKDIIVLNKFYKTKDPNLLSDIATIYESNEEGCLAFFEKKGISEEELVSYFLQ